MGKALVTGSTGFVGSAIVRALLAEGYEVRALTRASSDLNNLAGLDVERAIGDITDGDSVRAALAGCDTLIHTAAHFTHWDPDPAHFYDTNVGGTRTTLRAALDAGVDRVVYTSTNNAVGAYGSTPSTEDVVYNYWSTGDHYSISKYFAEVEALRLGAQGLPLVVVNPTLVVGPRDARPTSSGQMILDVASRRMPVYVDGWINVVDVDDVARGHVLAAAHGRVGQRYLLGGQNLDVATYFRMIAEAAGVPAPRFKAPYLAALGMAHAYELAARFTKRHPVATVSELKIGRLGETYDSSKARTELGFTARPARETIQRSVDWYRVHGYLNG